MKISGIYKIINKINGKYYIGSSIDIKTRWKCHKVELRGNKHGNKYLQRSWNKYGEQNFDFIIIEEVNTDVLLEREQYYLNLYSNDKKNYNISNSATSFFKGQKHTKKSKQKMSLKQKNRKDRHPHSLETKLKLSNIMKGRYIGEKHPLFGTHCSDERKEKISKANSRPYKEIYDEEYINWKKLKMSERFRGKNNPMYGKHHTDEAKKQISIKMLDPTVYIVENKNTGEYFSGTKHEFKEKYGFKYYDVYGIFNNKLKSYKGWSMLLKFAICDQHPG